MDDPAMHDGGVDAAWSSDAGSCPLERPLHVCSFDPRGGVHTDSSSILSLWFPECVCASERSCQVQVDESRRRLELTTMRCAPSVQEPRGEEDCACSHELECEIPAVEEGPYELVVDSVRTGEVISGPETPVSTARQRCWDAQSSALTEFCKRTARDLSLTSACQRLVEDVGTYAVLTFEQDCSDECIDFGPCSVELIGTELHVSLETAFCGSECRECSDHSGHCTTPPLRAGTYTVIVENSDLELPPLEVRDVPVPGSIECDRTDSTPLDPGAIATTP